MVPFSIGLEDKMLIKCLYECEGYNARAGAHIVTFTFIQIKLGRRTANSINRLLVKLRKFGTV